MGKKIPPKRNPPKWGPQNPKRTFNQFLAIGGLFGLFNPKRPQRGGVLRGGSPGAPPSGRHIFLIAVVLKRGVCEWGDPGGNILGGKIYGGGGAFFYLLEKEESSPSLKGGKPPVRVNS